MNLKDLLLFMRKFARNKTAFLGLIIFTGVCLVSLIGPLLVPYSPSSIDAGNVLAPPSSDHLMGTDHLGRDVFSRFIYGGRVSLIVAGGVALLSSLIGISIGATAGYCGGKVDSVMMRIADVFLIFPPLFMGIIVLAFLGASLFMIVLIVSIMSWPGTARLIRSDYLSFRTYDFVNALKVTGAKDRTIIIEILPNALGPAVVNAVLCASRAIIIEASLSFLGLGSPGVISWGKMLHVAQEYFQYSWWTAVFPGIGIAITVITMTLIGEGIRDYIGLGESRYA